MLPKEEKVQSNKLINRLYKQRQNKGTNKKMQQHEGSLINIRSSPEEKYLIPKIAKGRLKPIQPSQQLKKQIFAHHLHPSQSKNIHSTSKNILDNSYNINPGQETIGGLSKVRSKMYSVLDESRSIILPPDEEEKKYLTPNDFMDILKFDREMSDEFCYMNRKDGPYEWQIIEFEKKNPDEYMVISKRGLTKYFHDEVEFINFDTFLSEQKIYNRLNQIEYFKMYKKHKNFQVWKKETSMKIFNKRSKEFKQHTLIHDTYLKEMLVQLQAKCKALERIQTFYTQTIAAMSVEDFKLYAQKQRNKTIDMIRDTEEVILDMLIKQSEVSMEMFMKKMRISKENKGITQKKPPLLIGDETGKDMPYTESATLRTHQTKVRNFLKLTDYIMISTKTQLIINMITNLCSVLNDINSFYEEDKRGFGSLAWIKVSLYQDKGELKFTPHQDVLQDEVEDIIYSTLSELCSNHFQYLHLQEFEQYWKCNIEAQRTDEYIEIKSIITVNPQYNISITNYKLELKKALYNLNQYKKKFQPSLNFYKYLLDVSQHEYHSKDTEYFREVLYKCKEQMKDMLQLENQKDIGIFMLDCFHYKQVIEKKYETISEKFHQVIPDILLERAKQILSRIKKNYQIIAHTPITIKQYIQFVKNTNRVSIFADNTSPQIMDNADLLSMTESYSIKVSQNIKNSLSDCNGQMIGLRRRLEEIQKSATDFAQKFKKEILRLVPTFDERISEHREKTSEVQPFKNTHELDEKISSLKNMSSQLDIIMKDKQQLQGFQIQLGLEVSAFEEVQLYFKNFKYIESLWDQKKVWKIFIEKHWQKTLATISLEATRKYLTTLTKKITIFQRQLEPNEVVQGFKSEIETFKPLYNACQSLMSPELQQKHFNEIKELIKYNFYGRDLPYNQIIYSQLFDSMENSLYSLKFFKNLELDKIHSEVVNISVQAVKEAQLTEMIIKVEGIWKTLCFITNSYKEGKDTILGNNDEMITKIDDNLLTVNNILGSKYVGPIKPRVEVQAKMLRYVQDLIDEWYLHQKNWIYLEPILKSPFAMKNLPRETSLFNQIDSKWKHIMKQAKDSVNIRRYADEYISHYTIKILKANNETFEIVQKTLENFLEKKRDIFQRFYFLSNDQLLEILSTVKTFDQIEPHLRKVFEGFVKLELDDKSIPDKMISMEGEQVTLKNCVFRGEVQEWFKSAQQSMKMTLKSIARVSNQKYTEGKMKRTEWVMKFPSQIIQVVDCIMWTMITEGYLEDMQENDIGEWFKTNVTQLEELVQEIRRDDLTIIERRKIVALITQDVHFRDIVEGLEICESINDFKWIQQLRFYNVNQVILARQVQCELYYGYEYLGATTRLVITPLTDRCWMTITGALNIKLGANPAGPAGTGKTESCKDLAKSLARYCIVFNCSDQINASMMEKLFSGLAYTGSWTCLDEFNRIDIQVLSVIAQQVLTIREALLKGKSCRELVLGGKLITLNHDLGIFITMNPGYAGRTELPDNLKTLFRPVSMMVPDYTLIAEIMLFSEGFSSAKQLSKKMTKLYKLSSEQLSQQDHYDFGMRAVKSVLVMAGSLKRAEPNIAEDVILIRAMQDSNVPKFLSHDLPLFNGIIQDLFPSIQIPQRDQTIIINEIKQKCQELKLIPGEPFIEKNLQLNETLKVRFGVMLVGPPMGSKSSIISTLLNQSPIVINPKAVSLAELYGNFDPVTQTWTDGLAAKILRQSAVSHEYVLFDGPVDSLWIENLNTVLDDSMMLCLSNGERIKLSSRMRVLFEVNDLNQASPATVSRCGMVWVSEETVPWEDLIVSYFMRNPVIENEVQMQYLINTIKNSFKKGYSYIKKFCREMIKLNESTIVHSYCKFVKNHIDLIPQEALNADTWKKSLEKLCVYGYTWSVGALVSDDTKNRVDKSLSQCFSADSLKSPITNFTLSYHYKLQGQWFSWNSIMPDFEFPENIPFSQIFVPTKETYCYSSVIETFIEKLDPIYLSAPTGTGKTSVIAQTLRKSSHASLTFTFTAQTSPSIAQIQLESKLQTQRKAGNVSLIPPPGKKFVYFVDDINMPTVQQYGAQPPIEMLRLILGKQGVWDRKLHNFKKVEGLQMTIAGTHGRTDLPPRFLRFFNTIYIPELQEQSLVHIFSQITRGFFHQYTLRSEIMELIDNKSIVNSTLLLYVQIKRDLLPTPEKSHYLFNLRDVSRVIQGLTVVKPSSLHHPDSLVKLWVHEFQRVFEDRLISEADRKIIREQVAKKVTVSMKSNLSPENLYEEPIIFCNFLKKGAERKDMVYEEAKDINKVTKVINEYMQDETNLNLVLFSDAIFHLCRIARCFIFEKGHIVLIGLSGSGKKSLITLGGTLAQARVVTIQLRKNYGKAQFRQDLYKIMKIASFQNQQVAFLFPQNHMIHDSFLEDINNLLSSGEVPCMFSKQNNEQITQQIGYEVFLKRILANLHVCLTLSPIGQQFRTKVRSFPSLVNCCLLDWVDKWPQEALLHVGRFILEEKSVCQSCVFAHREVEKLANQFLLATRRKVYITPKNYIELLNSFNIFLTNQKNKIDSSYSKLSNGVFKLQETNDLIQQLKVKLTDLKPILQKKTIEQQQLLKKLEVDRQQAGQAMIVVEQQQKVIAQKTDKALLEKKQADRILNDALPALHAAMQALNTLNRNDISEIKMNQNPHAQVKFTLECVSILLQEKQQWQAIRKTISDVNFITRLKNLDVYNIPVKVEEIIKKKLKTNPNFKPNQIKTINFAAKSLCQWILAVVNFNEVNKQIVKKKTIVKKLNQQLAISKKQLEIKRNQLNEIIAKVKELEKMFNESKEQKEQLDKEIILTKNRLINAEQLTDGLKNEKIRWAEYLVELQAQKQSIIGNVFLSTCCVAYYGPYTGPFRDKLVLKIKEKLEEEQIKCNENFDIKNVFGESLEISEWINYGLPKDSVSINSALLVTRSIQNPMMIDPQIQAFRWIKNMMKQEDMIFLRMGMGNFLKRLESALRLKHPIMIETSETSIDPAIDQLISKDFEFINNRYFIRLGENKIEMDPDFKIYMYTKLSNPLFNPQIFIKLCVINFSVTPTGLEDQLLASVVQNQLPEVETKKRELVSVISKGKATLQKNQDKILSLLNNSKGNILDDVELIQNLKQSKKISNQVKASLEESVVKSKQIQQARMVYKPVASRGAVLFIIIAELSNIQAMYQFSLEYFGRIFSNVLQTTAMSENIEERVRNLKRQVTKITYSNISRALFNQHKKIFSFMIAVRIEQVPKVQYDYFLKGNFVLGKELQKPSKPLPGLNSQASISIFNSKKIFKNNIYEVLLKGGEKLVGQVLEDFKSFQKNQKFLPQSEEQSLITDFQTLLLTKVMKPQSTVEAITEYIGTILGKYFVESFTPTMNEIFEDISNKVPLVFILSVGADPLQSLLRLAKEMNRKSQEIAIISLGQGQGAPALRAISNATKNGEWVILQNCHLGKSFMPTLQKKVQQVNQSSQIHENFRLFLTSMPCSYFPVSILQNSLKVTSQPPRGMKANLRQLMNTISWRGNDDQKTLTFNLCFFHAITLERKKFGSLGWNILYDFNESDLQTSLTIVNNLIQTYEEPPWDAIEYFVGQIVYGGRVTDDFDRRLLKTLLKDFISPESIEKPLVSPGPPSDYLSYIEELAEADSPQLFGMHSNAQTTYLFKIAKQSIDSILLLEPLEASISESDKTIQMIEQIKNKIPPQIKSHLEDKKNPNAIDICLEQESVRFNKLIQLMNTNLKALLQAVKGQSVMTDELQNTFNSLTLNIVPKVWEKKAYPSLKPLSSWFEDLLQRVDFFRHAVVEKPKVFWISAFFFPQGFLTSVLQIYARKSKLPVDTLNFHFIFRQHSEKEMNENAPSDGCLVSGLYSEACSVDFKSSVIKESHTGVIDSDVPVIHFKPVQGKPNYPHSTYQMPLYKTKKRAGVLSTTGHSTNYIISIVCKTEHEEGFWIKRGAAFFCALDH